MIALTDITGPHGSQWEAKAAVPQCTGISFFPSLPTSSPDRVINRRHCAFFLCVCGRAMSTPNPRSSQPAGRVRRSHTLEFKARVIKDYSEGKLGVNACARKHGIRESTLRTFLKKKAEILASVRAFGSTSDASTRRVLSPACRPLILMEKYLAAYIARRAGEHVAVQLGELRTKALSLYRIAARRCNQSEAQFKASNGWIRSFVRRKRLHNLRFSGERASADEVAAAEYPDVLAAIIDECGYTADTVFNCDETGLLWKAMPRSTYLPQQTRQARGMKKEKQHLTVLLTTNVNGSCRMKPFVVGKAARPRCFRSKADLEGSGVHWRKGGKAAKEGDKQKPSSWMCAALAYDYFDNCFVPEARRHCRRLGVPFKVLLLMDNASCHPKSLQSRNRCVRVEFLPPNTTSLLQPLDQEVIASVKALYQLRVYHQLAAATDTGEEARQLAEERLESGSSGSSSEDEGDDHHQRDDDDHHHHRDDHHHQELDEEDPDDPQELPDPAASPTTSPPTTPPPAATPSRSPPASPRPSTSAITPASSAASSTASTSAPAATADLDDVTEGQLVSLTQFWRRYNIKHAIHNFVAAWRQVTTASILHSWRTLTPQFCQKPAASPPVRAATLAEEVAAAAQAVPGCSSVSATEVMEVVEDPGLLYTVEEVAEDVDRNEREEEEQEERQRQLREREERPRRVTTSALAQLLAHLEQAKQVAQDSDPNNDRVLRFLSAVQVANEIYEPVHRELVHQGRQAIITAYFQRQAQAAPADTGEEEAALEVDDLQNLSDDDEVASIVSDADFAGF